MIKLSNFLTTPPKGFKKDDCVRKTDHMTRRIGELQHIMFAEKKQNLLVVFQGMDASGKDGATTGVFQFCNPTGIDAIPFRKPTDLEFSHDFLWRIHPHAPAKGQIKVFIRSHYEDVLIQRVHNWIDTPKALARIDAINHFEELLQNHNNTTILKFYLHISKERQQEKLQERIDDPSKQWKHNPADWKEREHWDSYMKAYEDVINKSTIPWIIVPVDKRWYRDYFIAEQVLKTLEGFDMKLPGLGAPEV